MAQIKVTGNSDIDQATAEIAVALRDAYLNPATDQHYYDEAERLRDAIMEGTRELDARPVDPTDIMTQADASRDYEPGWFQNFMNDGCKDKSADYWDARGAVPRTEGMPRAEDVIREGR